MNGISNNWLFLHLDTICKKERYETEINFDGIDSNYGYDFML